MRSYFIFVSSFLFVMGCGVNPNPFGSLIPDPDKPGEFIQVPPAPIEVSASGVIVPPTAPVKTYRGGQG